MDGDRRKDSDDDVENVRYSQVPDKHHGDTIQAEHCVLQSCEDHYHVSSHSEDKSEEGVDTKYYRLWQGHVRLKWVIC